MLYLNSALRMCFSNDSENLSPLRTREQGGLRWTKWAFLGVAEGGVFQAWVRVAGYVGGLRSCGESGLSLEEQEALGSRPAEPQAGLQRCRPVPVRCSTRQGVYMQLSPPRGSLCVHTTLARESEESTFLSLPELWGKISWDS